MYNANPEKKARAKVVQTELNACRERLRVLEESKVRDAHLSSLIAKSQLFSFLEWRPLLVGHRSYSSLPVKVG